MFLGGCGAYEQSGVLSFSDGGDHRGDDGADEVQAPVGGSSRSAPPRYSMAPARDRLDVSER
jgi:hypothetical protein